MDVVYLLFCATSNAKFHCEWKFTVSYDIIMSCREWYIKCIRTLAIQFDGTNVSWFGTLGYCITPSDSSLFTVSSSPSCIEDVSSQQPFPWGFSAPPLPWSTASSEVSSPFGSSHCEVILKHNRAPFMTRRGCVAIASGLKSTSNSRNQCMIFQILWEITNYAYHLFSVHATLEGWLLLLLVLLPGFLAASERL